MKLLKLITTYLTTLSLLYTVPVSTYADSSSLVQTCNGFGNNSVQCRDATCAHYGAAALQCITKKCEHMSASECRTLACDSSSSSPTACQSMTCSKYGAESTECSAITCTNQGENSYACLKSQGAEDIYNQEFSGDGNENIAWAQFFSALTGLWVAVSGVFYTGACFPWPSSIAFGLSALFALGGEIATWAMFKSTTDSSRLQVAQAADYSVQLDALKAARKNAQEAADASSTKFNLHLAASIGYASAGVIALIEAIVETASTVGTGAGTAAACKTGLYSENDNSSKTSSEQYIADLFPNSKLNYQDDVIKALNNQKQLFQFAHNSDQLVLKLEHSTTNLQSYLLFNEHIDYYFKSGNKSVDLKLVETIEKYPSAILSQNQLAEMLSYMASNAKRYFSPIATAYAADGSSIGVGIGGGILATAALSATTIATGVNKALAKATKINGWARLGIYVANGVVAGLPLIGYHMAEKNYKDRVTKYDTIIADLERYSDVTFGSVNAPGSTTTSGNAKPDPIATTPPVGSEQNCNSGTNYQYQNDANCACLSTNSCSTYVAPSVTELGIDGGNPISAINTAVTNGVNSLSRGDSSAINTTGATVAQNAAKLRKMQKDLENQANDLLKKHGQEPIDFKKLKRDSFNQVVSSMRDGLDQLNPAQKAALLDYAGLPKDTDFKTGKNSAGVMVKPKPLEIMPAPKVEKSSDGKGFKIDFGFDDKKANEFDVAKAEAPKEVKKAGYIDDKTYSGEEDGSIAGRQENLFDLITRRYKESAYPNFFELKK